MKKLLFYCFTVVVGNAGVEELYPVPEDFQQMSINHFLPNVMTVRSGVKIAQLASLIKTSRNLMVGKPPVPGGTHVSQGSCRAFQ